jgi:hypothetical protein
VSPENQKAFARNARAIYQQRLKQLLEKSAPGQFVAIEVDSGDYFLGATPLEAVTKAKQRYPDRVFHVMKVGAKAVLLLKKGGSSWD